MGYNAGDENKRSNNSRADIGANPSAEDGEEQTEDSAQTVIDIVHSFRLNETQYDKKSYLSHLKSMLLKTRLRKLSNRILTSKIAYMKKVKETMKSNGRSDEDVTAFEKGAAAYAKKIIGNFKDYEFLVGESMDPDGMVILLNYREDGTTPYITVSAPLFCLSCRSKSLTLALGLEARSQRDEGLKSRHMRLHLEWRTWGFLPLIFYRLVLTISMSSTKKHALPPFQPISCCATVRLERCVVLLVGGLHKQI